jgi:hypothetical protein
LAEGVLQLSVKELDRVVVMEALGARRMKQSEAARRLG